MRLKYFIPNCVSWIPKERELEAESVEEAIEEVDRIRPEMGVTCSMMIVDGSEMIPVDELRSRRLSMRED